MYARMVTMQARLGQSLDDQRRLIEEDLLPLMRQQPGFRGYLGLADQGSGKTVAISLWDSESDNYAFGAQRITQEINAKFQPLITPGMGGAEGFSVIVNTLAEGG